MNCFHHNAQTWIDYFLRLLRIEPFHQLCRTSYVRKKYRDLFPFSFQRVTGSQYFFGKMLGNVGVRRGYSRNCARLGRWSLINQSATILAKSGPSAIWLAAIRTSGFEPCPALVAEGRIRRILGLAPRANHKGSITTRLHRLNYIKAELRVRIEGASRQVYITRHNQKQVKEPLHYVLEFGGPVEK